MLLNDSPIILPGDPEFDWTLMCNLPPNWRQVASSIGQQCAFICSSESGLLRPATNEELTEYLYGGEYDDRQAQIGNDDGWELEFDLQPVAAPFR